MTILTDAYKFYARTKNISKYSECSSVYASYTPCPENYAAVPGNENIGTSSFCVMRFEARDNGSGVPESKGIGVSWTNISLNDSSNECKSLGAKYDLISNSEWMTIARNIEKLNVNWDSGVAYTGCLFRGNNGLDDSCGYDAPGNTDEGSESLRNTKARLELSNKQTIWDFAGNISEWVDWNLGGSADLVPGNTKAYANPAAAGWVEFTTIDTNINDGDEMNILTWRPEYFPLNASNGIGRYDWGSGDDAPAVRGGRFINEDNAGIYMLDLSYPDGYIGSGIGFRCVYRP